MYINAHATNHIQSDGRRIVGLSFLAKHDALCTLLHALQCSPMFPALLTR